MAFKPSRSLGKLGLLALLALYSLSSFVLFILSAVTLSRVSSFRCPANTRTNDLYGEAKHLLPDKYRSKLEADASKNLRYLGGVLEKFLGYPFKLTGTDDGAAVQQFGCHLLQYYRRAWAIAFCALMLAALVAWITAALLLLTGLLRSSQSSGDRHYFLRGLLVTLLTYIPVFIFGWVGKSDPFELVIDNVWNGTILFAHITL